MTDTPLPVPRPEIPSDGQQQPATPASFEALQQRIKQNYGDNKCIVPPQPESLPDDNEAYNEQGFSRESVLDVTIQAIIDNGVDATFATEFATGAYGIESMYGDSWEGRLYGKAYVGPWQVGVDYMRDYYDKIVGSKGDIHKIQDQIIAVSNFVPIAVRALRAASPTGFVEPGWLYIAHQQGLTAAVKAIRAYYSKPDTPALSVLGHNFLDQAGFTLSFTPDSLHYNALATIKQFVDCEVNIFKQSMARGGSGNCGEYMVSFEPGATLSKGDGVPNFSKAVFDIWFMVTDAQMAAAKAQYDGTNIHDDLGVYDANMLGILPIVSWGANPEFTTQFESTQCGPSFIGVNCGPQVLGATGENYTPPSLVVRLQYDAGTNDVTIPLGNHQPDFFQIGFYSSFTLFVAVGGANGNPQCIPVTGGTLHHVLFSVDLNGSCQTALSGPSGELNTFTASSSIKAWLAMDDQNYNGNYFFPANPIYYGAGGDPQSIISNNTFYISTTDVVEIPHSASFSGQPLPALGQSFGIPATPDQAGHLFGLGAAGRVRIWFGETIDTSSTEERRLFIDDEGKAADAQLAVDLFGRVPDIQFGAGTDFLTGTNTGSEDDFTVAGTLTKITGNLKIGTTVG